MRRYLARTLRYTGYQSIRYYFGSRRQKHTYRMRRKNLDCEFFVTILNTFINEDYFPENRLKSFCATQIVDYLTQTNAYYEQFQIPNIERHFNFLINQSDSENNNLELMKQFFDELKKELLSRIENDKNCWFPSIKVAAETLHGEYYGEKFQPDTEENDSLEEKLDDLKSLFVIHLKGEYDLNLCHGVIFAIYSLEKISNNTTG